MEGKPPGDEGFAYPYPTFPALTGKPQVGRRRSVVVTDGDVLRPTRPRDEQIAGI